MTWGFILERVTRIELALSAWEADVLPLNYTRVRRRPEPVSERIVTLPHPRPPALKPWGRVRFGGAMRLRGAGVGAYGGGVGEGCFSNERELGIEQNPHPCPLPEYRARG